MVGVWKLAGEGLPAGVGKMFRRGTKGFPLVGWNSLEEPTRQYPDRLSAVRPGVFRERGSSSSVKLCIVKFEPGPRFRANPKGPASPSLVHGLVYPAALAVLKTSVPDRSGAGGGVPARS